MPTFTPEQREKAIKGLKLAAKLSPIVLGLAAAIAAGQAVDIAGFIQSLITAVMSP